MVAQIVRLNPGRGTPHLPQSEDRACGSRGRNPWPAARSPETMLSILVCHSYFLRFDPMQVERGKPYPPLATL